MTDLSNPIIRMSRRACAIWLDDPKANPSAVENDFRPLTQWAKLMHFTPPELRRWLAKRPQDWEAKTNR